MAPVHVCRLPVLREGCTNCLFNAQSLNKVRIRQGIRKISYNRIRPNDTDLSDLDPIAFTLILRKVKVYICMYRYRYVFQVPMTWLLCTSRLLFIF